MIARAVTVLLSLCVLAALLPGRLGLNSNGAGGLSFTLSEPNTAELLAWATELGIKSSKLAPGDNLAVKGLIAKEDISSGSTVVSMTRKQSLAVIDNQKTPFPKLVPADIWDECSQDVQVGLLLLKEVKKGSASKFDPWIQSLPTSFDTLKHWSDAEWAELQTGTMPGEQLKQQVEQQWADLRQDIQALMEAPLIIDRQITPDDLVWASDVVTSRSFAGVKRLGLFSPIGIGSVALFATLVFRSPFLRFWKHSPQAAFATRLLFMFCMTAVWLQGSWSREGDFEVSLLPVVDLINHKSSTESTTQAGRFTNNVKCILYDSFKAGEEVTHSYGDKNNEILLQYYGFVEEINVNDFYTADLLQFVKTKGVAISSRIEAFEDSPYIESLEKAQLKADGWALSTLESLRSLFASEAEKEASSGLDPYHWFKYLIQYREIPHSMTTFKQKGELQTEQQVFQVLQEFCNNAIASKPTTLEADIKQYKRLQADASSHARTKLALQFRIATKQLLHTCAWQYDPSQA